MTTIYIKKSGLVLHPLDGLAETELAELSDGEYRCELRRKRNSKFHRKFFSLIHVAFKAWEPIEFDGDFGQAKKSFKRFRKDIVIACGYYDEIVDIFDNVQREAVSISFAKMDDVEFARLYSTAIDVILQYVLTHYTKADLDEQVSRILGYC